MRKIILSGFEPFGGDEKNPSGDFLNWVETKKELLRKDHGIEIETVLLPVEFEHAFKKLQQHYEGTNVDVVLMLGLAKNRQVLTVERIGVNWIDARIPDNAGALPLHQKIDDFAQDGIFTTLDPVLMLEVAKKHNFQLKISGSAGEYVCNDLLFRVLLDLEKNSTKASFIHIPGADDYIEIFEHLYLLIKELK